jgi:phosphoserine phosphatase RsbU/P
MVKKERFNAFLEPHVINYSANDIIVLYTDGLVEGKNSQNEEFDYANLNQSLINNVEEDTKTIIKHITDDLYNFTSTKNLQDDCTIITIKMK